MKSKKRKALLAIASHHDHDPFLFVNVGLWAAEGAISMNKWALYLASLHPKHPKEKQKLKSCVRSSIVV